MCWKTSFGCSECQACYGAVSSGLDEQCSQGKHFIIILSRFYARLLNNDPALCVIFAILLRDFHGFLWHWDFPTRAITKRHLLLRIHSTKHQSLPPVAPPTSQSSMLTQFSVVESEREKRGTSQRRRAEARDLCGLQTSVKYTPTKWLTNILPRGNRGRPRELEEQVQGNVENDSEEPLTMSPSCSSPGHSSSC